MLLLVVIFLGGAQSSCSVLDGASCERCTSESSLYVFNCQWCPGDHSCHQHGAAECDNYVSSKDYCPSKPKPSKPCPSDCNGCMEWCDSTSHTSCSQNGRFVTCMCDVGNGGKKCDYKPTWEPTRHPTTRRPTRRPTRHPTHRPTPSQGTGQSNGGLCNKLSGATLKRNFVTPDVCSSDPSNCAYQCAKEYSALVVGSSLTLTSIAKTSSGCTGYCYQLKATVNSDCSIIMDGHTSTAYGDPVTFLGTFSGSSSNVVVTTQGVACTGSYNVGTPTSDNYNTLLIILVAFFFFIILVALVCCFLRRRRDSDSNYHHLHEIS